MGTRSTNQLVKDGKAACVSVRPTLATAYRRTFTELAQSSANRLSHHAMTAAAEWHMPHADEIYDRLTAEILLRQRTDPIRVTAVRAQMGGMLQAFGVSFDVSNPLIHGVLRTLGRNITRVSEAQRQAIMDSLQESYDAGLSIVNAADAITASQESFAISRSMRIAQTEIIGASNGGSLAGVRMTDAAERKVWLATTDDRVREDHADVDGESVALSDVFFVGGYAMEYPGDQDGPPEETVNCRCTLTYE